MIPLLTTFKLRLKQNWISSAGLLEAETLPKTVRVLHLVSAKVSKLRVFVTLVLRASN